MHVQNHTTITTGIPSLDFRACKASTPNQDPDSQIRTAWATPISKPPRKGTDPSHSDLEPLQRMAMLEQQNLFLQNVVAQSQTTLQQLGEQNVFLQGVVAQSQIILQQAEQEKEMVHAILQQVGQEQEVFRASNKALRTSNAKLHASNAELHEQLTKEQDTSQQFQIILQQAEQEKEMLRASNAELHEQLTKEQDRRQRVSKLLDTTAVNAHEWQRQALTLREILRLQQQKAAVQLQQPQQPKAQS